MLTRAKKISHLSQPRNRRTAPPRCRRQRARTADEDARFAGREKAPPRARGFGGAPSSEAGRTPRGAVRVEARARRAGAAARRGDAGRTESPSARARDPSEEGDGWRTSGTATPSSRRVSVAPMASTARVAGKARGRPRLEEGADSGARVRTPSPDPMFSEPRPLLPNDANDPASLAPGHLAAPPRTVRRGGRRGGGGEEAPPDAEQPRARAGAASASSAPSPSCSRPRRSCGTTATARAPTSR